MHYRFQIQRIGPVKLVLGAVLIGGLLLGTVLLASAVALIGVIGGLVAAAAGLIAYGVQRFLRPKSAEPLERRAEGIVLLERDLNDGIRSIEVEVIDDGEEVPGSFRR
jgi:hypothetical protein